MNNLLERKCSVNCVGSYPNFGRNYFHGGTIGVANLSIVRGKDFFQYFFTYPLTIHRPKHHSIYLYFKNHTQADRITRQTTKRFIGFLSSSPQKTEAAAS